MTDIWSASPLRLSELGDWATWTINVPNSTIRDHLNNPSSTSGWRARGSVTAANDPGGTGILIINDRLAYQSEIGSGSGPGWISDRRYGEAAGALAAGFAGRSVEPGIGVGTGPIVTGDPTEGPFVVGTNTLRLLWIGDSDTTPGNVDLDWFLLVTGGSAHGDTAWAPGDDEHIEATPPDFASHVDGTELTGGITGRLVWVFRATDVVDTGHAEAPTIIMSKVCPQGGQFRVRLRFENPDGTPSVGEVAMQAGAGPITYVTLDAQGRVDEVVDEFTEFLFTGSATLMPRGYIPDYDKPRCGGWVVGKVGIG